MYRRFIFLIGLLAVLALACQAISPSPVAAPTRAPQATATALPQRPVQPGADNPDEPVYITGEIPYTSPFFMNSISEPFVMLEDQAGFAQRDRQFQFSLPSQAIGPVEMHDDGQLTYSLALPSIPQGTQMDLDNNGQQDTGVQVFAVAYWSNTWGDPFLEERDGTGWSTAYASTITDPENQDEISGGTLIVWAPDDQQAFPTGFGPDGLLFTEDDPTAPIPAGYNLVDLSQEPFQFSKTARPELTLLEGDVAVNDLSELSYADAFDALFEKVAKEYPFTAEKGIDWQALYNEFAPQFERVNNDVDFYNLLRQFSYRIPDRHVGMSFNNQVFFETSGGSFGMILAELSDGSVIVQQVLPGTPAEQAGIQVGAQILTWNGLPVAEAINNVTPYFGPYSTATQKRLDQLLFLTRVPVDTAVDIGYQNPEAAEPQQITLVATQEYESLFNSLPELNRDVLSLPVEGRVLEDSGLGYIRINTFSDDYRLMAHLWSYYMSRMLENGVPGLIIDVRANGGGSTRLARDFAGYFYTQEVELYQGSYYSENTGQFEPEGDPVTIEPGPVYYDGPVALLVSPRCISACEGFSYAMQQAGATVVGHFPTAGAFGEVGRGQYKLPGDVTMQFPTGRPETLDGQLLIEGVGVVPDVVVPVTREGVLGSQDTVLDAAVQALQGQLQ